MNWYVQTLQIYDIYVCSVSIVYVQELFSSVWNELGVVGHKKNYKMDAKKLVEKVITHYSNSLSAVSKLSL